MMSFIFLSTFFIIDSKFEAYMVFFLGTETTSSIDLGQPVKLVGVVA